MTCRSLDLFPWCILESENLNDAVDLLTEVIHSVVKDNVPVRNTRKSSKFPPWFDDEILLLLRNKKNAWKLWKQSPSAETYKTFADIRRHSKFILRKKYSEYINSISLQIPNNPRRFWQLINSRKKSPRIPLEISYNNKTASCNGRASLFIDFFSDSLQSHLNVTSPQISSVLSDSLSIIKTTPEEVKTILQSLPPRRALAPDNIHSIFLRHTSESLAHPLSLIINRCFSEGIYPDAWKKANLTPILKSGKDKKLVSSYRPISLLSPLSTVCERIIKDRLHRFLSPYINPFQHAFLPGVSCLTNLSVLLSHAITCISQNSQMDILYLDLSNAFNSINHEHLLFKLQNRFNIHGKLLSLLSSYLSHRQQRVVLPNDISTFRSITSGVPQGSVLGPILFLLFMDDLSDCFHADSSKILLFADDCKLFRQIDNVTDAISLQNDLSKFENWCNKWNLQINPAKSTSSTITLKHNFHRHQYKIGTSTIAHVNSQRDLGVIIDQKLSFDDHISSITKSSMRILGLLYRFTEIRDPRALSLFYKSYVSPILEYCSPIWTMACPTQLNRLNSVVNFFAAIVRQRVPELRRIDNIGILNKLCIATPHNRHKTSDMMFLHKVATGKISCPILLSQLSFRVPARTTRNTSLFYVAKPRLNLIKRSLASRIQSQYNALSNEFDLFSSERLFRSAVNSHFM